MPKPPIVKSREARRVLAADGWFEVRRKGSHVIFEHLTKPGIVVLPDHPSKDIPAGTMTSILSQAGLTVEEFQRLR